MQGSVSSLSFESFVSWSGRSREAIEITLRMMKSFYISTDEETLENLTRKKLFEWATSRCPPCDGGRRRAIGSLSDDIHLITIFPLVCHERTKMSKHFAPLYLPNAVVWKINSRSALINHDACDRSDDLSAIANSFLKSQSNEIQIGMFIQLVVIDLFALYVLCMWRHRHKRLPIDLQLLNRR